MKFEYLKKFKTMDNSVVSMKSLITVNRADFKGVFIEVMEDEKWYPESELKPYLETIINNT